MNAPGARIAPHANADHAADLAGRETSSRKGATPVKRFYEPKESLGKLEPDAVAALLASAGDIALVIDEKGVIRDVAFGSDDLSREWDTPWLGRSWTDTVTSDSRTKVETLIKEATGGLASRWRHVNHPSPRGIDVPIQYTAIRLDGSGRVVAIGRDLRSTAALQQRLVEAQQSMERDYSRLRQMEMRYRLLFQTTPEAILIADASTFKIAEANPAATSLLGDGSGDLVGRALADLFDTASTRQLQEFLSGVRATGRAESVAVKAADAAREMLVAASLFRQEGATLFLVRVAPMTGDTAVSAPTKFSLVAENLPDGIVVTDAEGRVQEANTAFLDLAELVTEEQVRGESLERWLGRPGVDLSVLLANLKQHGSVRLYATTLRGEYGASSEIEVSAVALPNGERQSFGFSIRNIGRRLASDSRKRELPRSVEQLTELVGRVPLKDLVRETTDVVERLCIEAALDLTGDNRASAAEILGLSRQSLYVKLHRYGLGDIEPEGQ